MLRPMRKKVFPEVLSPADYAAAIKELRGTRSQKEVAERGEIAPHHWNRFENAASLPEPETQGKLAKGLGVEFERFAQVVLEHAQRRWRRRPTADASQVAELAVPYDSDDSRLRQVESKVRASAENLVQAFRLFREITSPR